MSDIQLERRWSLGSALAEGGFGRVYEARDDSGVIAVAKLVPKAPGAGRELLFEDVSGRANVIPIIESGEVDDYFVLVMPRAEQSLRQRIDDAPVTIDEAITILTDVIEALAGLSADVVHRDLKPENILSYGGHWCIADFGIARYAEATTAPDTHKFSMTPPYASPEQWRGERATPASDVYSFGIIAFELIEGVRPFSGPDYRKQHLEEAAPSPTQCPNAVASLVSECLFKAPEARPTAANVLARLSNQPERSSEAFVRLEAVNKNVVERRAELAASASSRRSSNERREHLFQAANVSLTRIITDLTERVRRAAPSAEEERQRDGKLILRLGDGTLIVDAVHSAEEGLLAASGYEPPFDVIAYTAIGAKKPRDRYDYEGRAHSFWFADAQEEGVYRWYELGFMVQPLIAERSTMNPFALPPTDKDAKECLTPVTTVRQVAWQPLPFDQGDEGQFIERWVGWFAAAADGSLSHPSSMPERSGGGYRKPIRRPRNTSPF